jgi:hypothetical protein
MTHLSVLTPVVLLLLMVALGRLERWLDASTLPPPARAEGHRWRRHPRRPRPVTTPDAAGGRLAHGARAASRRRVTTPLRTSVTALRSGRRQRLGARLRPGR